jgi:hypothetical protein
MNITDESHSEALGRYINKQLQNTDRIRASDNHDFSETGTNHTYRAYELKAHLDMAT